MCRVISPGPFTVVGRLPAVRIDRRPQSRRGVQALINQASARTSDFESGVTLGASVMPSR